MSWDFLARPRTTRCNGTISPGPLPVICHYQILQSTSPVSRITRRDRWDRLDVKPLWSLTIYHLQVSCRLSGYICTFRSGTYIPLLRQIFQNPYLPTWIFAHFLFPIFPNVPLHYLRQPGPADVNRLGCWGLLDLFDNCFLK
jgi:hypothetical protein